MMTAGAETPWRPDIKVGLFVTCLVDLFRPTVGFATLKVLEQSGCLVVVPQAQTCCGQPAYNAGDMALAQDLARAVISTFEAADVTHIVVPSGSCAGMLAQHYPQMFEATDPMRQQAMAFAAKVHELTGFLVDVLGVTDLGARLDDVAAYHDSCSCRREMKVVTQPRALLDDVAGLTVVDLENAEECCGFGGTFAVKYAPISTAIVADKAQAVVDSGARMLLAADLGCLMNIAGKLSRDGHAVDVRHIAEVLANMTPDVPPITATAADASLGGGRS